MKLYLSSYHLGKNAAQFADLVKGRKRVGIIGNALDFSDDLPRVEKSLQREESDLAGLGFTTERIDLRTYFGKPFEIEAKVDQLNGLWVIGGNTFILRRAMAESGLDLVLQKYVKEKQRPDFVYAGYSAGACVLPATLKGIDLADDPNFIPTGYKNQTSWDGLSILPYYIAPHYRSDHPESEMTEKTVEYYIKEKMLFVALKDGEDLVDKV